jgi:hypothetical protein
MNRGKVVVLCFFLICLPSAWSTVFVQWSRPTLPTASALGVNDIVVGWNDKSSDAIIATARKQGYRLYLESPIEQATTAAASCAKAECAGVILTLPEVENGETEKAVADLRTAYPKLRFLLLNPHGKKPEMRGSLIIKRDSILEVSSPTAQPWIDSNLGLVKVEQRSRHLQIPMYTFSWDGQGPQSMPTVDDYALAVSEAGAFHADLILKLDEHLQSALINQDLEAWALWNQVRSAIKFSADASMGKLNSAANVAVAVDRLDINDEVLNLLSRHNIPFAVFRAEDLKTEELKGFDVLIVFVKPGKEIADRIYDLASRGVTVVLVDAHDHYPWQRGEVSQVNEHTNSYSVGRGKILELSEPVSDPEIFAQDIRRLLGKNNALLSLWNGLTTIALPYKDHGGMIKLLEFVNYSGEHVPVQVRVKGSFKSVKFESPERKCCESLAPVQRDGFTEFVIPELNIAGRAHLDPQ